MGLGDLARRVDVVIEDDQDAESARRVGLADSNRADQVARAIEVGLRGVALRAGQHDRFVGPYGQVEEPGRLLQRAGAMGDDHGSDVVARNQLLHPPVQGDPIVEADLRRRDAHQVVDLDRRGVDSGGVAATTEPVQQPLAVEDRHRPARGRIDQRDDRPAGRDEGDAHHRRLGPAPGVIRW